MEGSADAVVLRHERERYVSVSSAEEKYKLTEQSIVVLTPQENDLSIYYSPGCSEDFLLLNYPLNEDSNHVKLINHPVRKSLSITPSNVDFSDVLSRAIQDADAKFVSSAGFSTRGQLFSGIPTMVEFALRSFYSLRGRSIPVKTPTSYSPLRG